MKTTNNLTKNLIGKLALVLVSALSMNANAQTTVGGAPDQMIPPHYKNEVGLQGYYAYESRSIRFFLNLFPDRVAYPLERQTSPNTISCGTDVKGEFCQPIAPRPPMPIPDRYIAHLQTSDCWGWAPVLTKDGITNGFTEQGLIRFRKFSIQNNVGIVPVDAVPLANDDRLEQDLLGETVGLQIGKPNQCRDARRAAKVLERAVTYSVSKDGLNLRLKSGRILKLKRVYTMPLPGVMNRAQ